MKKGGWSLSCGAISNTTSATRQTVASTLRNGITTNFTRHENETKVFDELLLCIQIIKPLKEFCHKVMLHPEGLLKINSFP